MSRRKFGFGPAHYFIASPKQEALTVSRTVCLSPERGRNARILIPFSLCLYPSLTAERDCPECRLPRSDLSSLSAFSSFDLADRMHTPYVLRTWFEYNRSERTQVAAALRQLLHTVSTIRQWRQLVKKGGASVPSPLFLLSKVIYFSKYRGGAMCRPHIDLDPSVCPFTHGRLLFLPSPAFYTK